jgi:hypothetical protein
MFSIAIEQGCHRKATAPKTRPNCPNNPKTQLNESKKEAVYMDGESPNNTVFWGFDTEFLPTGKTGDPTSVHSVQFSNGHNEHYFLETPAQLKRWLDGHRCTVKEVFGFNMLCDLGAVKEWLPPSSVRVVKYRGKLIGTIRYSRARIHAYDTRPLLTNFGLRRLADIGDFLGVPKLLKPHFLGLQKWSDEEEHRAFRDYALNDAVITSRAAQWLISQGVDPRIHASAGTLASEYFDFPKRHERRKARIQIPPIERAIGQNTSAGRSEAFHTGFIRNVTYNDVKSLYPCSIFTTRALMIDHLEPCDPKELAISRNANDNRFGWMVGFFKTKNKNWGLPIQAKNVTYVTGYVNGLFHTFDLAAADAQLLTVSKAYRPVFNPARKPAHLNFADLLAQRLNGKLDANRSGFAKAVLNSTYGKLGQSHPEAATTNYLAYSTILAHSHLIMSNLFNKCPTPILGMDTDSIFSQRDMSGTYDDLSDGDASIPLIMEVKGRGDLAMFRAKTYMMREEGKPIRVYGRHTWNYFVEDYFRLWENIEYPLETRIEVKHTLKTQDKQALSLPLGFWVKKPVKLTKEKISALLQADSKRLRPTLESFNLFLERESAPSYPYDLDESIFDPDFEYPRRSHEKFPFLKINRMQTRKKV